MIKAIETVYKGYRFRSRLEARWAVVWDTLGLIWEYEKEGYDMQDETGEIYRYLPDFYLPELDMYVEAKGTKPNKVEEKKADLLSKLLEKSILIVVGLPQEDEFTNLIMIDTIIYGADLYDIDYFFCECPYCNKIGCEYEGRAERMNCCKELKDQHKLRTFDSERFEKAYRKARQARFEFKDEYLT